MALRLGRVLDRLARHRAAAVWSELAEKATRLSAGASRDLSYEALNLRQDLNRFLLLSDRRVAVSQAVLDSFPLPPGTDWRWRPEFLSGRITPTGIAAPESGTRLGASVAVWHDCPERALILRQVQNIRATELTAFKLRMEVLGFSGSFLSLSIELPPEALQGLTRDHVVRFETSLQPERPLDIYARLNIRNGPDTDEMLRHLGGMEAGRVNTHVTEFDLAYTEINEQRLDKIWLDLIFEKPWMHEVTLREAIVSRHRRANL